MDEIKKISVKNLPEIYDEYKEFIFPTAFYITGMLIGTIFYSSLDLDKIIASLIGTQSGEFLPFFINKLCLYITVYTVTVLFGMCLIGFPFINVIPLLVGIETAIIISYYYVNYSMKGIGFSLLLIIPENSAFFTVLLYTIRAGNELSKYIYSSATKKSDMSADVDLKTYLKSFLFYALIVVLIALVNTFAEFLLKPIISI